jgi:hypothetical protein
MRSKVEPEKSVVKAMYLRISIDGRFYQPDTDKIVPRHHALLISDMDQNNKAA